MASGEIDQEMERKALFVIRGMERDADEEHHDGEKNDAGENLHAYSLPI